MNSEQLKLLSKMKRLINAGKCRFEERPDRNYISDLTYIGIDTETAWMIILGLNTHFYFPDERLKYYRGYDTLIFKRRINRFMVYIKLKLEVKENNEEVVCLSFHRDSKDR